MGASARALLALCASGAALVPDAFLGRLLSVAYLGFPRFTGRAAPLVGPHRVAFTRARLGGVDVQLLYPSTAEGGRRARYARAALPRGLANYTRMPRALFTPLAARAHPCPEAAAPLAGDWPLVVFSHGLGGSLEMYTGLCASLASLGHVVVALEHADGSACYAEAPDGAFVPYARYAGPPGGFSKARVVGFRAPFLRRRLAEIDAVVRSCAREPGAEQGGDRARQVLRGADASRVHLVGHSFGAAGVCLAARERRDVASASLLDPWSTPLDEEAISRGVGAAPLLAVLSDGWARGPEAQVVRRLISASEGEGTVLAARNAAHTSFSDASQWFPGVLAKRLGLRGRREPLHAIHRETARALSAHIRRSAAGVHDAAVDDAREYEELGAFSSA